MGFNDQNKLEPEPRDISDRKLLQKTLEAMSATDSSRETFEGWLDEIESGQRKAISPKQRAWVNNVLDEYEPRAANLVSRGLVPRGREVETPEVLKVLPLKPPGRK
jgi:hypothetical protein